MDCEIRTIVYLLCFLVPSAVSQCAFQVSPYVVSETDPAGTTIFMLAVQYSGARTVIFSVSKTTGVNATLQVVDPGTFQDANFVQDLQSRFRLINKGTTLTLETTSPLDLEEFMLNHQKFITNVLLKITCDRQESDIGIIVRPVNEFSPVMVNSPYNINVAESTAVGTIVFKLKPKVRDQDVGEAQNFIFRIKPYYNRSFDGKEFFSIPASSQGNISVYKALDYDFPFGRTSHHLNVSVSDGQSSNSKTVFTVLNIFIQDADDQAPYFDFPNCPKPCTAPPYEATTRLEYTGQLTISPNPLRAVDDDTLGTPLLFSITSGNQHNLFEINENTGVVTQNMSVNALNLPDAKFVLVIEVGKILTSTNLSSIAILTVHVWERKSNNSRDPEPPIWQPTQKSTSKGPNLLIPVIAVGVALALASAALAVALVKSKKLQSELSKRALNYKAEAHTQEEQVHTDAKEYNTRTYEKLTLGEEPDRLYTMPLRDTVRDTTNGKTKKSKNKEPESFCELQEYSVGLDPTFLNETDETNVKRPM